MKALTCAGFDTGSEIFEDSNLYLTLGLGGPAIVRVHPRRHINRDLIP